MKLKLVLVVMVVGLLFLSLIGCVRPTLNEALGDIRVEDAPYIVIFRNDGWIDGAILVRSYEFTYCYLEVNGYYDRHGFHEGFKYIPLAWLVEIKER